MRAWPPALVCGSAVLACSKIATVATWTRVGTRSDLGATLLGDLIQAGISILSIPFTRKPMPLALSCQAQIARASLRWWCVSFWLFFGVAVRFCPPQLASSLTLIRPDRF